MKGKTDLPHWLKAKQQLLTRKRKERITALMKHQKWSPARIAKPLTKEGEPCLSHVTINRFGRQSIATIEIIHPIKSFTKTQGIPEERQKRSNVKDNTGVTTGRIGIENPPDIGKQRSRIGDIGVDLMMGRNHKSPLLVITDTATLVTMIQKLNNKNAHDTYTQMKHRLNRFNPSWIKTIPSHNR